MNIEKIEDHYTIKLIKFTLERGNKNFTAQQAAEYCNIGLHEFNLIWKSIFIPNTNQTNNFNNNEEYRWELKPEAFFSYMSYLEYKDSLASSKKALKIAIISIIIASVLAILQMIT